MDFAELRHSARIAKNEEISRLQLTMTNRFAIVADEIVMQTGQVMQIVQKRPDIYQQKQFSDFANQLFQTNEIERETQQDSEWFEANMACVHLKVAQLCQIDVQNLTDLQQVQLVYLHKINGLTVVDLQDEKDQEFWVNVNTPVFY